MRLHEYIRTLNKNEIEHFEQWRRNNSSAIYKIKQRYYTDKKNKTQQALFESKLVERYQTILTPNSKEMYK